MLGADLLLIYKTRLQADFPDLPIDIVNVIGEGWDHTAIEVNGSLIFRMPREVHSSATPSQSVPYETAILKRLGKEFPVAIPDPCYIAPNSAYFGYPKLPGTLVIGLLPSFNSDDNTQLRKDWVTIARAIHTSVSKQQAESLGVPVFSPAYSLGNAQKIYDLVNLRREIRDFVDCVLEKTAAINIANEQLTFIHNDLHFLNMLASPKSRRVTGVIDWSDVHIAPLAREFSVWEWMHDGSIETVAGIYEAATGHKVDVAQARLWKHLEELSDFVEQARNDDREGAERSMEHIRQWAAERNIS